MPNKWKPLHGCCGPTLFGTMVDMCVPGQIPLWGSELAHFACVQTTFLLTLIVSRLGDITEQRDAKVSQCQGQRLTGGNVGLGQSKMWTPPDRACCQRGQSKTDKILARDAGDPRGLGTAQMIDISQTLFDT